MSVDVAFGVMLHFESCETQNAVDRAFMEAKIAPENDFPLKSAKDVVDYIKGWLEQDGRLRIDPHLKIDRAFRNVSTQDCKYVFANVTEESLKWPVTKDEKHGNFPLEIAGTDLDDQPVRMLFVIDFRNFRIVVFNWLS